MDVVAMREGLAGRLRLGVIPTALPVMTLLSGPLLRRHRGLDLSIRSITSREIEHGLHESAIDAGVTYLENEPLAGVRHAAALLRSDAPELVLCRPEVPAASALRWRR